MNYLKFILSMVIFGTIGVVVRNIDWPSSHIVLARTSIATIVFLLVFMLTKKNIEYKNILKNLHYLFILGVALALSWIFLFEAYMHTSLSVAIWINYLAPIIVILLAPFLLKEPITLLKLICIVIALVGLYLVSQIDIINFSFNKGVLYAMGSASMYSIVMIFNKKIKNIDPFNATFVQMFIAALTMIVYVFVYKGETPVVPDNTSILLLVLLGVVHTGLACFLMFSAIPKLPTSSVAFLGYLDPIFTFIFAYVLLGEMLNTMQLIGSGLILLSAILAQIRIKKTMS
ncbi:MAG: DMT family transporter [Gemella sp.]|nr:DMT family transporter [Gemella sp.]